MQKELKFMKKYISDLSIAVVSCAKFKDTWPIMSSSLNLIKRSGQVKIYWITDGEFPFESHDNGIIQIKLESDKGWDMNLADGLERIPSEHILYLQDDYFITEEHNMNWLSDVLQVVHEHNLDYYRVFHPVIGKTGKDGKVNYSECSDKYALCLRPAVWKKSVLLQLLSSKLNPWEFERGIDKFIKAKSLELKIGCVPLKYVNQLHIRTLKHTAIHKGYWTREAYDVYGDVLFKSSGRELEGMFRTLLYAHKIRIIRPVTKLLLRFLVKHNINI